MVRPFKCITRAMIRAPFDAVSLWHLREGSFARSFPSWERMRVTKIVDLPGSQRRIFCLFKYHYLNVKYLFRTQYISSSKIYKGKLEKGPYKVFDVTVNLKEASSDATELVEKVEYLLKFPYLFGKTREKYTRQRILRFWEHKHQVLQNDLTFLAKFGVLKPLRVLISGSNGLIGSNLVQFFQVAGHDVYTLVRSFREEMSEKEILFNLKTGESDRSGLEGFDVVVHLSGSSIQDRWTHKNKQMLLESRSDATKRLAKILASLTSPPKVFISASAVGFYGDRGDAVLTEKEPKGEFSFLADVCKEWEEATYFLKSQRIRVVNLRFGAVLSSKGGALQKMLPFFRLGLGSPLGKGDQYMSWISVDDAVYAIYHAALEKTLSGPVNIVSPSPVTNAEFVKILAKHLKKNEGPMIPRWLLIGLKGQMAEELLLSSIRAKPEKLLESGYRFFYPTLEETFQHLIF